MDLRAFLPSLTNLPVFHAELVMLLLLFSVSSYALLNRLRTGPLDARAAVRLRTRLAVSLPAWVLWAIWVGFGAFWLGIAGLAGGSRAIRAAGRRGRHRVLAVQRAAHLLAARPGLGGRRHGFDDRHGVRGRGREIHRLA